MIFNKRFTLTRSDKFGYFNFIDCKFKTWVGFFDFNESGLFSFTNVQIDDHIQLTRCSGKPFVIITEFIDPRKASIIGLIFTRRAGGTGNLQKAPEKEMRNSC